MLAKKLKSIGISCAAIYFMLCTAAYADAPVNVLLDGARLSFDSEPRIINDRVMVPMRAIFEAFGAQVNWNEDNQSITSDYDGVNVYLKIDDTTMRINDNEITLDSAPVIMDSRTLVPVRAVSEAFNCKVDWDSEEHIVTIASPVESHPLLDDVIVTDEFRYNNFDGEYNGVRIFDNGENYFGMEIQVITKPGGEKYAEILNGMADDLPDVRVFCGVIPTAAEFYASNTYKSNYKAGISHIYNKLSDKVIPLNIEGAMNVNAGHYLYFRTDHQLTHFGAYCAYLEFCDKAGFEPVPIDRFETRVVDNYLGSWGKDVAGTDGYDMLNGSRDRMVVYKPIVEYTGMSYYDMEFNQPIKEMKLIMDADNYYTFIEGDFPIEHFHTNVNNGKSICMIKESFGNPFSTWLVNNYEDVYIIDYRSFNGHFNSENRFKIKEFYDLHHFDDLLLLNYPLTFVSDDLRQMLTDMWR